MAATICRIYGIGWRVEELKDLITHFTQAVTNRLDDHDILIELRTTQANMLTQLNQLVGALAKTVDDHENRIRRMERMVFYGAGMIGLAITIFKTFGGKF